MNKTRDFPDRDGGHRGQSRQDFRWMAVRNMVDAGTPEPAAMTVIGRRTHTVVDRFPIVGPGDLREVAQRMDEQSARLALRRLTAVSRLCRMPPPWTPSQTGMFLGPFKLPGQDRQ